MNKIIFLLIASTIVACTEKETASQEQSFEEFKTEYFNARQGEELDEACGSWFDDCVAAGHSEEDCGTRLEYCENGEWGSNDDREDDESEETEASECERQARRAYEECINTGASEEDCRSEYEQAYNDCEGE